MPAHTTLHALLAAAATRHPDRIAVDDSNGARLTYAELAALADALRDRLRALGVAPGDRVGFTLRKSADAIVAIFGILQTGAAYVPVDPLAPASRNAYILNNCSVRAVIVERGFVDGLRAELGHLGDLPPLLVLDETAPELPIRAALAREQAAAPAPATATATPSPGALAYILYTSGSTGNPKGVMLTHRNAMSYVDWCTEVFAPTEHDRLSNHAPLHFDLSILDVFLAIKHGATLVPIGEEIGKEPKGLAALIAEKRITIWYSAPSILTLLAQHGDLARHDASALRLVLFAGEVFPIKHLRALTALWPHPRYFNLYGPTETNVCTFFETPAAIPDDRKAPYPIGKACSHYRTKVVDEAGRVVAPGQEGELCAAGDGAMQGYWNLPAEHARAFLTESNGERWYRTGDIVSQNAEGDYVFLGRRDRMVKRRGYRVELGEIEAGLYRHPDVEEAAVLAFPDEQAGVRIQAVLRCRGTARPSVIALKRFCSEALPMYMIPDAFAFVDAMPKTSTGKIDYQKLKSAT